MGLGSNEESTGPKGFLLSGGGFDGGCTRKGIECVRSAPDAVIAEQPPSKPLPTGQSGGLFDATASGLASAPTAQETGPVDPQALPSGLFARDRLTLCSQCVETLHRVKRIATSWVRWAQAGRGKESPGSTLAEPMARGNMALLLTSQGLHQSTAARIRPMMHPMRWQSAREQADANRP